MSRRGWLLLLLLSIPCAIGLGAFLVPQSQVNSFAERLLVNRAADHGVRLEIRGLNVTLRGSRADQVSAFWNRYLFSLAAEDVRIDPHWMRSFGGVIRHLVSASLYGGTMAATVDFSPLSSRLVADGSLDGLSIAKHPQLSGLGFTEGTVSCTVRQLELENGHPKNGRLSLKAAGITKPYQTTMNARQWGLPLTITIPAISDLRADIEATLGPAETQVPTIDVHSSLGEIVGSLRIPAARTGMLSGAVDVALTRAGLSVFGPYLPLLSGGALKETDSRFQLTISGTSDRPRFTYRVR